MNSDVLLAINGWAGRHPWLDGVMVFTAVWLIYLLFTVAAICLAFYVYGRQWKPVLQFAAMLVVTFGVLKMMELLNVDHRPFMDHPLTQLVPHAPGQSFPSDHTTSGVAVALGILVFTRFQKTGVILLLVAVAVGFSRIYVGVHYPADIAGGILTAAIGCGLVLIFSRIMAGRQQHPGAETSEMQK